MIRRDQPLGAVTPDCWLLIPQVEHARLSGEIAQAWGGPNIDPLVCPPDEPDHALAAVRRQLVEAAFHHDDGWLGWSDSPAIDPESGRPYSFTEMPTEQSQRIWSDSIAACHAFGPLAGWVVAAHFSALQSKRDGDYPEWIDWLAEIDARRAEWLDEWLAASDHHTRELADRCLAWLQTLDWISLWLCCRCPALPSDRPPAEPLTIGDDATGWPQVVFRPAGQAMRVEPWPFIREELSLKVTAVSVPVGRYAADARDLASVGEPIELRWRLAPG